MLLEGEKKEKEEAERKKKKRRKGEKKNHPAPADPLYYNPTRITVQFRSTQ
jgi:hypothetical protein